MGAFSFEGVGVCSAHHLEATLALRHVRRQDSTNLVLPLKQIFNS